eukprot:5147821-Pyramimonas_sp.AAC.1
MGLAVCGLALFGKAPGCRVAMGPVAEGGRRPPPKCDCGADGGRVYRASCADTGRPPPPSPKYDPAGRMPAAARICSAENKFAELGLLPPPGSSPTPSSMYMSL